MPLFYNRTLASEADFNQVEEYESDSDCSDIDSTDFDLRNWSMVNKGLEDKLKRRYGLMFRRSQNGKLRHYMTLK